MIPLLMQWLASSMCRFQESLFLNAVKVVLFRIALGVICHAIFRREDREDHGRSAIVSL